MAWQILEQKDNEWLLKCPNCDIPSFWSPDPPERTHHSCTREQIKRLSIPKKALNLSFALGRFFKAKAIGKKTHLNIEQYEQRLLICDKCNYRDDAGICLACGCGIKGELFGKAILTTEKCPLNKWPILYEK